uniref:Uncharacterized protein n=1 Tax=Heliothis virescens TaxID=7102 RepID=A0A2A4K2B4_HELVI
MASFIVLSTILLLLASVNAAPSRDVTEIKIPAECQGKEGFCSVRPEGYDEIEKKFKKLLPDFIQNVDTRSSEETFSPNFEDNDNCPFTSVWESVYYYKNHTQITPDIIVQTNKFPQKFLKVQCKTKAKGGPGVGGKCFTRLGLGPFDTEFECRETMASRSLIVYDPVNHKLEPKTYNLPVSCSCHVRSL